MMALLRDHGEQSLPTGPDPVPTLCMHANPALSAETAGSMVVQLRPDRKPLLSTTCWTSFGSPCLSIFRPVYPFAVGLPGSLDTGADTFNPEFPWWVFERLQRLVARAPSLAPIVRNSFSELEKSFLAEASEAEATAEHHLSQGDELEAIRVLRTLVDSTTERALDAAESLIRELRAQTKAEPIPAMVEFWDRIDDEARRQAAENRKIGNRK